jgi:hypothetical protein
MSCRKDCFEGLFRWRALTLAVILSVPSVGVGIGHALVCPDTDVGLPCSTSH